MSAAERVPTATPLELLHPAGWIERVRVIGDACPEGLVPPAAAHAGADVGLALVAPSPAQLARRGWLGAALADAATAVSADGLVHALLPPPLRSPARRRLRASGLEPGWPMARLPARDPRYLVPVHQGPWRHMLGREIGAHPRLRRVLSRVGSAPGGTRLIGAGLPGVAITARRARAAPLAAWLAGLQGETAPADQVAVLTSWRGPAGPTVLFCFRNPGDAPWGIAKVGPGSQREAQRLERLGAAARAAGAEVPRLLATGAVAGRQVLVETPVAGRSAARVLTHAPESFPAVARALADWLERWSVATARRAAPATAWLEPAALAELPVSYRAWLDRQSAANPVPPVAAHHDLTMWNVRLGEDGGLGVLDWAEAEAEALPLTDLFYALADAAAACGGYRDPVAAARSCFEPGGSRAATVAPLVERLRAALDLSPAAAELCFHAAWLRHAANERRAGAGHGPFQEIVRWLAHRAGAS